MKIRIKRVKCHRCTKASSSGTEKAEAQALAEAAREIPDFVEKKNIPNSHFPLCELPFCGFLCFFFFRRKMVMEQ